MLKPNQSYEHEAECLYFTKPMCAKLHFLSFCLKRSFCHLRWFLHFFGWKNNFVATWLCWKKDFHLLLKMIITFMLKITQLIRIKYSCFVMKKSKFNRLHPFSFRKNILEKDGIEHYEAPFELNKPSEVFGIVFKHLTNRLRWRFWKKGDKKPSNQGKNFADALS